MVSGVTILMLMLGLCLGQVSYTSQEPPPDWLVENVEMWRRDVFFATLGKPGITTGLVLAVIAQESQGDPYRISTDGWESVGLMQIIPRGYNGSTEELLTPRFNIETGVRMLDTILKNEGGEVLIALARYNCGDGQLKFCGHNGGINYARRVLDYWLPYFERSDLDAFCSWRADSRGYWSCDSGNSTGHGGEDRPRKIHRGRLGQLQVISFDERRNTFVR